MSVGTWRTESHSEAQTEALASAFAQWLTPGTAILLSGDLGAGKSVFARGILRGLGVEEAYLTSPTFTLVNVYGEGRLPLAHFDLYRLASSEDVEMLGLEEYVNGLGIVMVEWPERCEGVYFGEPLEVRLFYVASDPNGRQIVISALGQHSQEIMHGFQQIHPVG